MSKKPGRADYEYLQQRGNAKHGALLGIIIKKGYMQQRESAKHESLRVSWKESLNSKKRKAACGLIIGFEDRTNMSKKPEGRITNICSSEKVRSTNRCVYHGKNFKYGNK